MDSNLNKLSPLVDFANALMPGQMANEDAMRSASFKDLVGWLQGQLDLKGSELLDPVAPGTQAAPAVIPPGPEDSKGKFEPQPGFYNGFPEVTADKRWYFYWDMNAWSLIEMGDLPKATGVDVLDPKGEALPTEKAVADYSVAKDELTFVNKFNKDTAIPGKYINTNTGALTNDTNSSYSQPISVVGYDYITILGRNATNGNLRFLNSAGGLLKPVNDDGSEFTNYSPTQNGKQINDIFKVPTGAVSLEMNLKFNNTGDGNSVMVLLGKAPLNSIYKSYNESVQVRPEYLPKVVTIEKKFKVRSVGDYIYIGSAFSSQYDIITGLRFLSSANDVINIASNKLINKGDDLEVEAVFGLNGGSADDASPINFNGGHLGGNHGYFGVFNATVTGHGKTVSDVGSVWQDADGLKFYLLQVPDSNTLTLISQNTAEDNGWLFVSPSGKSLIYVSGASNTSNFTVGSANAVQLYPCIKNLVQEIKVDDLNVVKKPATAINYLADKITINESYDIIDVTTMVALIVENRPVGGYTIQPSFGQGDAILTVKNRYEIGDKNNIILSWSHIARNTFELSHDYGTQNTYVRPAWSPTYNRMIPGSLPISDGTTLYDFRNPVNIAASNYAKNMDLTSAYWANDIAPIRNVDGLSNGTTLDLRFNIGIIPTIGASKERNEKVGRAFFLAKTRKTYPIVMDDKVKRTYRAGDVIQGVNYRGFTQPSGIRYNYFQVEVGGKLYVFIDYSNPGIDTLKLDSKWNDKFITVYNKSEHIKVAGNITTAELDIFVSESVNSHGFLELIIE